MSTQGHKVIRELERCAAKAGVTITAVVRATRHSKVYIERDGRKGLVTAAGDSTDWRALKNVVTQMRKAIR